MSLDVLVTGANRGIGLEFVRQLSARGDRVTACCRRPADATELLALGVEPVALDVTDPASVAALRERLYGRAIDLLLNNAGVGVRGRPLGRIDYAECLAFFDTNALGPLRLVEALLPALRAGRRRLVVNMTSKMGSIADNTSGDAYAYRASKAALNMITRSLAVDLADEGIACVVLHPGWVQTDMGGAGAPVSVQDSVAGLLAVIDSLAIEHSGRFFDYLGQEVPW